MVKLIQVETDEQKQEVKELFLEYLLWVNSVLDHEFAITFDMPAVVEQDMAELGKFDPPHGRLLLVEHEGQIGGIACLRKIAGEVGEVKRMYVRPAFRGKGLGRALLEGLSLRPTRSAIPLSASIAPAS